MRHQTAISDYLLESQLFLGRAVATMILVIVLIGILIVRLIDLQIVNHHHFSTRSQANQVQLQALPPTRGLIFDRNGEILAQNLPTFSLELIPDQIPDLDTTLHDLAALITLTESDLDRFHKQLNPSRGFRKIALRFRLTDEEVARFSVNRHRFPGVDVHARLTREYPKGELTSHVIGYVGRINVEELERIDPSDYSGTSHIGKTGIEKTYEDILHGDVGVQHVETNALGRTLQVLKQTAPIRGNHLHLTLDIHLQEDATTALGDFNGSVIALHIPSGGILAMVSKPTFDTNLFVNGIDHATYQALNTSADKPLFNRSLFGQYPPGSTIKPMVGLAGLQLGIIDSAQRHFCPGFFMLPGKDHKYRDWKKQGHAAVNLDAAITQSCDVYFYKLGLALGIDKMQDFLSGFGLGEPTGLDIVGEQSGLLPSRDWKRRVHNQPWFPGETLITAIGQGFMLTTPLQLARATAILAKRGEDVQPKIVRAIETPDHSRQETLMQPHHDQRVSATDKHWDEVIASMIHVVHGARGTARAIGVDAEYTIAGKTGTAQVFSIKQDEVYQPGEIVEKLRDHSLFIGFAPVDDPQIAVAVVVENGGSGSKVAAPIARRIMDRYLRNP